MRGHVAIARAILFGGSIHEHIHSGDLDASEMHDNLREQGCRRVSARK